MICQYILFQEHAIGFVQLIQLNEYADNITSPEVKMITLDGCGHNVQYSEPKLFSIKLKELLKNK